MTREGQPNLRDIIEFVSGVNTGRLDESDFRDTQRAMPDELAIHADESRQILREAKGDDTPHI